MGVPQNRAPFMAPYFAERLAFGALFCGTVQFPTRKLVFPKKYFSPEILFAHLKVTIRTESRFRKIMGSQKRAPDEFRAVFFGKIRGPQKRASKMK